MRQLLTGRDGWRFCLKSWSGTVCLPIGSSRSCGARFRCGKMDGQAYRDAASDPASVKEIIQTRFANEMGQASFCQKDITATEEAGMVHCCFCPLVDAWQKMALPQDRIELLCDIAMDGDRAILDLLGFSMELPCTLAHGDPTCTMHYSRDTQQY